MNKRVKNIVGMQELKGLDFNNEQLSRWRYIYTSVHIDIELLIKNGFRTVFDLQDMECTALCQGLYSLYVLKIK